MKLAVVLVAFASAVISSVSAQAHSFNNLTKCQANSVDQVSVTSIELTPFPICIKEKYCISITGNSQAPITQGAIVYQEVIIAGRMYPHDPETDLCKFLAESGNPCPIPAGPVSLKVCFNNPGYFRENLYLLNF
ncbi:hypothetical protein BGZ95_005030 [Linnemannia exigua]|uniref:Phosphatidylglycerol/phosphatidylinositol transfer protein n=1 Tax=Linnemannia exigua TaxID=604196 RepID=A0AAD4H8U9_9FUNG|nr:hypothetical protein BGZ95_005030 [Linnemannia exigua]